MGKDHITHDKQALVCGEKPSKEKQKQPPGSPKVQGCGSLSFQAGAGLAFWGPAWGRSIACGLPTGRWWLTGCSPSSSGEALGTANLSGPRVGLYVSPKNFVLQGRFLTPEERSKGKTAYSWGCRKTWESCPRKSTSVTRTGMASSGKEDGDSGSQRPIGKWKVYKLEEQELWQVNFLSSE